MTAGRLRPLRGQSALERERSRVLRQAMLEQPRQLLLDRVGTRAARAAVEMGANHVVRFEPQAAFLVVAQVQPHLVTGHSSLTARSP
jgi:hypothetical protein